MTTTTTQFSNEKAPCGKLMDGERLKERDEDYCLVTDEKFYTCGCTTIRHEYHDGSVSRKIVRHDGKVLVDKLNVE